MIDYGLLWYTNRQNWYTVVCILIEYIILYGIILLVYHYIRRSFLTDPLFWHQWTGGTTTFVLGKKNTFSTYYVNPCMSVRLSLSRRMNIWFIQKQQQFKCFRILCIFSWQQLVVQGLKYFLLISRNVLSKYLEFGLGSVFTYMYVLYIYIYTLIYSLSLSLSLSLSFSLPQDYL